jgi:peptidoglycan/LPS O-acetylase OafA/YrhL
MDESMNQRVAPLDALRGLAATYVVVMHVAAMHEPDLTVPTALSPFVYFGGTGVVLFFVMSAFSLHLTWPGHAASGRALTSFWVSRLMRIAPLYLCLLAIMVMRDALRPDPRYPLAEVAATASMLFGLSPEWQHGIVMGGWTIGVEVLFYLLFPLVIACVRNLRGAIVFTAVALLGWLMLASDPPTAIAHLVGRIGLLTQLPLFALGGLCFHAWRHLASCPEPLKPLVGKVFMGAGLAGLALMAYSPPAVPGMPDAGWLMSGLAYGLLLVGVLFWSPGWFVNRATRFLGTISYSLYLLHPLVVPRLYAMLARLDTQAWPPGAAYLASLVGTLMLAIPLAYLAYRFIERPAIELGRHWLARPRTVETASVSTA